MLSRVISAAVHGVQGTLVTVEADISPGLPSFSTVGLPDASVREARDRVIAAIRNSGFDFPVKKITVNLAPAELKKEGAAFDLPMAVGILSACEAISARHLLNWCLVGELALDGSLRPVKGVLPLAIETKARGLKGIVVPAACLPEAQAVSGLEVFAAQNLREVLDFLDREKPEGKRRASAGFSAAGARAELDFSDVKGQQFAKRALEIACAGAHNILMIGPPGSGKTMLSKRVVSILPPLTFEESLETSKIHSVAGLLRGNAGLVTQRPFRNPHHTISYVALIGGGSFPKPGEVSLAHHGVLFLDELPEFHRSVLEVLRQPLEAGEVVVARAKETLTFPADFMLVAAMNPCPCGYAGHPARECVCSPLQVQKYRAKVSGPLLDRMDIHLEVPALRLDELTSDSQPAETSDEIRQRVVRVRRIQSGRFRGSRTHCNARMSPGQTRRFCELGPEGRALLRSAMELLGLSARAYDRILKVARTIADLGHSEAIETSHLAEAIQYRSLDRAGIPV